MSKFKKVLAVETSCDDTSVAIIDDNSYVLGLVTANQDLAHKDFGGVVPEIAGRNHSINLLPLIDKCLEKSNLSWNDIDGLAVTSRPGLIGSLLVGLVTIKSLSLAKDIPYIGINHLEGHLLAPFLKDDKYSAPDDFSYPYLALAISGGHTQIYEIKKFGSYKVLGKTLDDAAGEAFDKFAKVLGLGFPGGPRVDKYSIGGDPKKYKFPRALSKEDNYNYSFSGVKASSFRLIESMTEEDIANNINSLCASYQEAIVDALLIKIDKAVKELKYNKVVLTGGVSANSRLREKATQWAKEIGIELVVPPLRYCTDNAAMIGLAGIQRLNAGEISNYDLKPSPQVTDGDIIDG